MKTVRFLVIGDPEGRLRYPSVKKLAERYLKRGDFLIFTGDWFSNPLTEYYAFKRGEAFPEKKTLWDLNEKYKIILIYGNKDLQSRFFGLDGKRSREKNIFCVEDFYGEKKIRGLDFCWLNGSNVVEGGFCKRSGEAMKEAEKILKRYERRLRRSGYKRRIRLKDLPEEELKPLREKYGWVFRVVEEYPYATDYSWLKGKRSDARVLLSHSPPLLEGAEVVAGSFPDVAVFREEGTGIRPCFPDEKGAKKKHVGLKPVSDFVKENDFRLVICGHIHEGSGIALYENALVVNPGSKRAYINERKVLPFSLIETDGELSVFRYLIYNWDGRFEGKIEI